MDKDNDIIPLDKLISRLKIDLKLSKSSWVSKNYKKSIQATEASYKDKKRMSIIYYLEQLKQMNSEHLD